MAHMDDDDKMEPCERWFKMPRKLFQSEAGSDPYLIQLMAWMCERARFTETSVSMPVGKGLRTFRLLPGELIVGRNSGSDALKWTPSSFRNRLQRLESLGLVTLKTHKKFTIVSVCFLAVEKDNRKRSVKPMNSTGYRNRTDSKRTIEGQRGKVDFTNEFASETSSSILGKGQLEDNRRTIEGQLKDTNTEGSECTDESEGSGGEATRRRSLRYLEIQYADLRQEVREALALEMVGAVASGAVGIGLGEVEYQLGKWAAAKRPKSADGRIVKEVSF
jgi:hypothetical protein